MSSLLANTRYACSTSSVVLAVVLVAILLVVIVPTNASADDPTKRQDWQPLTSVTLPYPTALAAVPTLGDLLVILGGAWQNPLSNGVLANEQARIEELSVASEVAQRITSDPTNAHLSDEHLQSLVRIAAKKELRLRQIAKTNDAPTGGWVPFSVFLDTIVQPNISVLSISENKFLDAFFIGATPANTTTPAPTNAPTNATTPAPTNGSASGSFPNAPIKDTSDATTTTTTPITSSMRSGNDDKEDENVPSSASAPSGGNSNSASSGPFPPLNTVLPALLDYASMGISSTVAVQGSLFTLGMCTTIPNYVPISITDSVLMNYLRNVQRLDLLIPRNKETPITTPTTPSNTTNTTATTNATTATTNSTSAPTSAPEAFSAAASAAGASFLGTSGLYLADEADRAQHVAARRTLHAASTLMGSSRPPKQRRLGEYKKVAPQVIDPADDEIIRFYSTNPAAQPDPDAPASDPYTHAIRAGDLRHANRNGPARRAATARIQELHRSVSSFVANSHTFSTMSLAAKGALEADIAELHVLLDRADHNDDELGATTGGLYFSSTTHTITPEMVRFPRFNATCVAYGSNIHVVGGIQLDQDGNMMLSNSIDLYVPASNKFVSGAALLEYAGMSLGITTDDTLMYITGGWMDPNQPSQCQFRNSNGTVSRGSTNENGMDKEVGKSSASKPFIRYNTTVMIPMGDATPSQRIAALASTSPSAVTTDSTTGEKFVSVVMELSTPQPPKVVSRNTITFRSMATSNQNCFSLSQQSDFFDDSAHVFAINGTLYNCFGHCATIITPSLRTTFPSTFYNTITMTPTSAYNAPLASVTDSSGVVNMYLIGGYYPGSGTTLTAVFRAQLNQASTFEADVFGFHFYPPTTTTATTTTPTTATTATTTTPTTTSTKTTTTETTTTKTTTVNTTTTTTTPETTTNETTSMAPPTNGSSSPSASASSSSSESKTTTTTTTVASPPPPTTTTTTLPPALRGVRYADRNMQIADSQLQQRMVQDDPPAPPTTDYPDNDGNFNNLVRHFRPVWVDTPFYVLFESSTPMTTTTTPPATTTASGTSASFTTTTTTTTTTKPPPSPPLFWGQCNQPNVFCILRISSDSSCSASIVPDIQLDNTTISADFPVAADAPLHNTLTGVGPVTIPMAALTPLPGKDGIRDGWFGGVTAYICISLGASDLTPLGLCDQGKPCNSYFVTPLNSADPFLIMNIVDFVPSVPTTTTSGAPNLPDDDGLSKVTLSYIIIGAVVVACMGIAGIFFVRHIRELRRERDVADERSRLLDSGAAAGGAANNGQGQLLDGKYRVLQRLGKGSFSVVYLVERVTDFRRFALKYVLCADDLDRTEAIKECDVIHKLQGHPNVIQLFDMFMSYRFDSLSSGTINNGAPGRSGGNSAQTRASLQKKKSYDVYDDEYLRNPIVVDRGNNQSAEQNAHTANGERYLSLVMEYHEKGDIGKYIRGVRQYTQRLLQAGGQALNPTFHTQQLRLQLQGQNNGKLSKKQQKENAVILARPPFAEITISEGMVVSIAYQVLSVLHFMHARSPPIIHRDLKPENLLMSSDEYDNVNRDEFLPVVVTDFGLSRVMDATFCETGVGSLPYVAPECWHRQYSTKIDIWALGCILYGICTRRVAADNVKVMFADCSRPDFKSSVKRDVSELSTIAFGLMTPHQLAQAVRQSSSDSNNSSSRRIASGGRGAMDNNTSSSTAAANNGASPISPTNTGPLVLNSEPASAVEDRPQYLQPYSPQLATFILSMLEPDPNLRPTASQLLQGIKKVYQRRGPAGKVPTAAGAATVDRPPASMEGGRGPGTGLRDSGDSMASKTSSPIAGSVGAVFGKGAAATGQDIQLDAQCVFYVDPEFTEIKDNGMPPASVSANKSLLSKSSSNALRTGSTPKHGPMSPPSATASPATRPAPPTLPVPEATLGGGNTAARRSSGDRSDVGSIDGDDSRYSEPDDYSP